MTLRGFILAVGVVACSHSSERIPEVEAFRKQLANPVRYDIRNGLRIAPEPIKRALDDFAASHQPLLEQHFAASLDALPRGVLPGAPEYGQVFDLRGSAFDGFSESLRYQYVLDPDGEHLAMRSLGMSLPVVMNHQVGLNIETTGAWMSFLFMAKPTVRLCGRESASVTICVDYGGLDVFVVAFARRESMWAPESITWQQRGRRAEKAP